MRKIYLILAAALSTSAFAQEVTTTTTTTTASTSSLVSKRGEAYLPVGGEWAIGASANSFLRYAGNLFSGATVQNAAPTFDYASNASNGVGIFGKLMVDENTAYRIRFNVSVRSNIHKAVVAQDQLAPDPNFPAFAEDWRKVNTTAIVIAPGLEKRRGSTRLQGIYGGELVFGLSSSKTIFEYGNAMSTNFTTPTSTEFNGGVFGANGFGNNILGATRITEYKFGSNFLLGARGFIGVEYFIAPKISLGGEFGYMLGVQIQGKGLRTDETWDPNTLSTRNTERDVFNNAGLSSIGIGVDNLNTSINLLFYF